MKTTRTMPVAPEKLLMVFSLAQVAEMMIAFEDSATDESAPAATYPTLNARTSTVVPECATVRCGA